MRLLFHTDSPKHHSAAARLHRHRIKAGTSSGNSVSPCRPVTFEVKTGQKYAIYVKKVEMGRYVAVATPDTYTRKVRKAARKLLCQNCRKQQKNSIFRTIPKVIFLDKKSILTKPQHFHEFFIPKKSIIFSGNQSLIFGQEMQILNSVFSAILLQRLMAIKTTAAVHSMLDYANDVKIVLLGK